MCAVKRLQCLVTWKDTRGPMLAMTTGCKYVKKHERAHTGHEPFAWVVGSKTFSWWLDKTQEVQHWSRPVYLYKYNLRVFYMPTFSAYKNMRERKKVIINISRRVLQFNCFQYRICLVFGGTCVSLATSHCYSANFCIVLCVVLVLNSWAIQSEACISAADYKCSPFFLDPCWKLFSDYFHCEWEQNFSKNLQFKKKKCTLICIIIWV